MRWLKRLGLEWPSTATVRVAVVPLLALATAVAPAAAVADRSAASIPSVAQSAIPSSPTTTDLEVRPFVELAHKAAVSLDPNAVVAGDLEPTASISFDPVRGPAPKRGAIIEANRARGAALRERWGHLSAAERRTLLTTKKIGNAYQGFYREAYQYWSARGVSVRPGQNATTVLGQRIDARARLALIDWAESQGLGEAQGLFINRRLYDYVGSGRFRIPDVRYEPGMMIWDGTIGHKTPFTPQVQDFSQFSRGYDVRIVTPW